jgi:glycosyltransferase involved in cell wall biosynthesis
MATNHVPHRKFTVVIPTRDRADTLLYAIKSALSQDYQDFTVLVSDNASEDNTPDVVASIRDERLRYVHTGRRLSMSHNWEFALGFVPDGWVTIIGDDDAILPGALTRVSGIADETGTQAVRANVCRYQWPTLRGCKYGALAVDLGRGYRKVDSGRALQAVMDGRMDYTRLPVLYNGGFISMELIKEAKSRREDGLFFRSLTPDVYSAMVFSLLTDEYVYSDEPLAINGASIHSGGTASFGIRVTHRKYDPAQKFWSEPNIPFHKSLPPASNGGPVLSLHAMVYEAYLQAEDFHDRKEISVDAAEQLQIIMREPRIRTLDLRAWAKSFAELHGFSPAGPMAAALARARSSLALIRIVALMLIRGFRILGTERQPLLNVHEASLVTSHILTSRPGSFARTANALGRVWHFLFIRPRHDNTIV